jgi:mannose/cellobiose epimerase-like protein (N-acyl-D-glucosamine 2-epimerase family)
MPRRSKKKVFRTLQKIMLPKDLIYRGKKILMNSETDKYKQFPAPLLSEELKASQIAQVADAYRLMLISVLQAILDRYEKHSDYHFIDTKLSLIDGHDYTHDDLVRGQNMIYAWIQGRGLEALAGHALWLKYCNKIDNKLRSNLVQRIQRLVSEVLDQMEILRQKTDGRLFFMMTPAGQPVHLNENGKVEPCKIPDGSNYSDLFYVKGMAAASHLLGLSNRFDQACNWFWQICQDIQADKFVSDQQSLDPRNVAVKRIAGRNSHSPRMIGVGAAAVFLKRTQDPAFTQIGLEFLEHILSRHVHLGNESTILEKYDMWEFIDSMGKPYIDKNQILLSDPGHACEFVGLALDLLKTSETLHTLNKLQIKQVEEYKQILPCVLRQNFQNGFSLKGFGICKTFNLLSRAVLNSDMPWWSLPETMRAALAACQIVPLEDCLSFAQIAIKCSNAFVSHYIKSNLNSMAIQTLTEEGKCADVIPATPDADPGYHTGLSIIDCLELYDALKCNV